MSAAQEFQYRVLWDVTFPCNCPDCPVKTHATTGEEGPFDTAEQADNVEARLYDPQERRPGTEIKNIRIERRPLGGWERKPEPWEERAS